MTRPLKLNPDRLFPADPTIRSIARSLYETVADLPIISPHGHTDPSWFATDDAWTNATELLLAPDHYLYRMLYSQGIRLERLGVPNRKGESSTDPREAWRLFAANYFLFRGTPSRLWLDHVFATVFGIDVALEAATADLYYDTILASLATAAFRPRALFDRFR
ncbi:MAG: uxaC, partial [Alphaproteobacteria bacterium]|nr:uxaC [Alphaproteobacteria bacterium]